MGSLKVTSPITSHATACECQPGGFDVKSHLVSLTVYQPIVNSAHRPPAGKQVVDLLPESADGLVEERLKSSQSGSVVVSLDRFHMLRVELVAQSAEDVG